MLLQKMNPVKLSANVAQAMPFYNVSQIATWKSKTFYYINYSEYT